MTEFSDGLTKAVDEQVRMLCHIRKCSRQEGLRAVVDSYRTNLRDSAETSMESYWRLALEIADRKLVAEQGFTEDGARRWE